MARLRGNKKRGQRYRTLGSVDFRGAVFKVLKITHPDLQISNRSMQVMNSLCNDILEQLSNEASSLVKKQHRKTMQCFDLQTAVKLIYPGELHKRAVSQGYRAVSRMNEHTAWVTEDKNRSLESDYFAVVID
ncbi:histone-fold-containing protein [Cladochytrium replicatum]|nr:histone-fold-containing protein [Cladochytrium replicatum]